MCVSAPYALHAYGLKGMLWSVPWPSDIFTNFLKISFCIKIAGAIINKVRGNIMSMPLSHAHKASLPRPQHFPFHGSPYISPEHPKYWNRGSSLSTGYLLMFLRRLFPDFSLKIIHLCFSQCFCKVPLKYFASSWPYMQPGKPPQSCWNHCR